MHKTHVVHALYRKRKQSKGHVSTGSAQFPASLIQIAISWYRFLYLRATGGYNYSFQTEVIIVGLG
jgi:hypothetical protein